MRISVVDKMGRPCQSEVVNPQDSYKTEPVESLVFLSVAQDLKRERGLA